MADDDDVAEDWEDVDTEEFERRMEVRQKEFERKEKKTAKNKSKSTKPTKVQSKESSITPVPLEVKTQLPLRIQDSERTEYVAPIKILKRQGHPKTVPSSGGHLQSLSAASTTTGAGSRQHKSLAEREADYASARARILGSDYKPGASEELPTVTPPVNSSMTLRGDDGVKRQPRGPNGTTGFKS